MTDLELTKLAAEAMGINAQENDDGAVRYLESGIQYRKYDPLHDDAQAMALVKRFCMTIDRPDDDGDWGATVWRSEDDPVCACRKDLNRAIVECVAKMRRDT